MEMRVKQDVFRAFELCDLKRAHGDIHDTAKWRAFLVTAREAGASIECLGPFIYDAMTALWGKIRANLRGTIQIGRMHGTCTGQRKLGFFNVDS